MSQHPFALYNPALLPPDVLLGEYTARLPMLETLLGIVRGNKPGHPPQHCLLIGARGMGKTTTLWALAHRISRDAELSRQWQPVVFDEESRRVGDLADFWLEAIRHWEAATKDTTDRAGKLLAENPSDIEDHAQRTFLDLVKQRGKRAILLIDNLNDLFASIRDPEPLHRLRAFLMQDSSVILIGGATSYFEHVTNVDQPFFDFFRYFELKALTLDEMRDCLLNLAKTRDDPKVEESIQKRSGSIQALHILTGGNPRLIKTFYRLLHGGLQADIRSDLEKLLDDFTPYFKAIVDALPFQQQRIFDSIALAWDPVEVASIATATRLPSNQVSAQIRALIKAGLIREAVGNPKRKTYLLTDRFSNIHYIMRHGRAARNRLDWFVATLRVLFPDTSAELIAKLAHDSAECGPHGLRDARDVLDSALTRSESPESRRHLLHSTLKETWDAPAMQKLGEWFDLERAKQDLPEIDIIAFCQHMPEELRKELGYKPEDEVWWNSLADFLEERKAWKGAGRALVKSLTIQPRQTWILNRLGDLLTAELKKYEEAKLTYEEAIRLDPEDAWAWTSLGYLFLEHLDKQDEAEAAFRKAINYEPERAWALIGLGDTIWMRRKAPIEAEVWFRRAIETNPGYSWCWVNLARIQVEGLKQYQEAQKSYTQALTLEPNNVAALLGLAGLQSNEMHNFLEAAITYEKAINIASDNAWIWNDYGNLLMDHLNRPSEAEKAYKRAVHLSPNEACHWQNLGSLYMQYLQRPNDAESAYKTATRLDPNWAPPWRGLGDLYNYELSRPNEAESAYRKALRIDQRFADAWVGLMSVLEEKNHTDEVRRCSVEALLIAPETAAIRKSFLDHCNNHVAEWQVVLPQLFEWCLLHSKSTEVFDFVIDGVVRYAQFTSARDALDLFEEVSDATPFETIQDALFACQNREYLHKLAPERQAVALELMKRIQEPKPEVKKARKPLNSRSEKQSLPAHWR